MSKPPVLEVPKWVLTVLNHLYEIERKLALHGDPGNATRNVERIKEAIQVELNLFFEDPMGQQMRDTRTDLEANISGSSTSNLVVTEVIKPIIRFGKPEFSNIVQKGIVIVEGTDQETAQ